MPVVALFENLKDGVTVNEFVELFLGVDLLHARSVLDHAAPPRHQRATDSLVEIARQSRHDRHRIALDRSRSDLQLDPANCESHVVRCCQHLIEHGQLGR